MVSRHNLPLTGLCPLWLPRLHCRMGRRPGTATQHNTASSSIISYGQVRRASFPH